MSGLSSFALPVVFVVFVFVALAWPLVRLWMGTGVWGITAWRSRSWTERAAVFGLLAGGTVLGACMTAPALVGWEVLGVEAPGTAQSLVGWLLCAASLFLVVRAQADMGASWRIGVDKEPTDLVTGGVYQWIRNPIYTGLFGLLVSVAVLLPWWPVLVVGALTMIGVRVQTLREETHMRSTHGEAWASWARDTGRFVPGLGRIA